MTLSTLTYIIMYLGNNFDAVFTFGSIRRETRQKIKKIKHSMRIHSSNSNIIINNNNNSIINNNVPIRGRYWPAAAGCRGVFYIRTNPPALPAHTCLPVYIIPSSSISIYIRSCPGDALGPAAAS